MRSFSIRGISRGIVEEIIWELRVLVVEAVGVVLVGAGVRYGGWWVVEGSRRGGRRVVERGGRQPVQNGKLLLICRVC